MITTMTLGRVGGGHDMSCASVNYDVSRKFYRRLCSTVSVNQTGFVIDMVVTYPSLSL